MNKKQVERIDLGKINASICIGASATIEAVIEQNKCGTAVNKRYVSDLIGEDVISTWKPGQIIMIISGTDTGKSYFIRNRVYEHESVPKEYNKDKSKIPRGSWGFWDLSLFFFRKKGPEIGVIRGGKNDELP